MSNNIKARLFKYRSASSASFDGVAEATYENGITLCSLQYSRVCSVFYSRLDNVFLITGLYVSPNAAPQDAARAGDIIDALLEKQAHSCGVSALLMSLPGQDQCEEIRKYTPAIPQNITMGVGCSDTTPAARYLN